MRSPNLINYHIEWFCRDNSAELNFALYASSQELGYVPQTLNEWVRKHEVETGMRDGVTSAERERVKALEREVKELRKANEILKLASAFFAQAENGLYKVELIHRRAPWKTKAAVDLATPEWVSWFNHQRLLEPIGYIPPAEAEENYYRQHAECTP